MPDSGFMLSILIALGLFLLLCIAAKRYDDRKIARHKEREQRPIETDPEYWAIYTGAIIDLEEAWRERSK
jgi:hypothetical protein